MKHLYYGHFDLDRNDNSDRYPELRRPAGSRVPVKCRMIEPARDPFSPLETLFGYAMAVLVLIYSFRQMSGDSQPSAFERQPPTSVERMLLSSDRLGQQPSAGP